MYGQPMIPDLLDDEEPKKLNSSIKAVMRRLGIHEINDLFMKAYNANHPPPYEFVRAIQHADRYRAKGIIPEYVREFCEANSISS